MYRQYLDALENCLENICAMQSGSMEKSAERISQTLLDDGIVYLFGCGHSHIPALEGFYRAGGLGAVCPILQSELMLHEGAVKSSALERRSELAAEVFARYAMCARDTLVVFSNSGINGLPVEMAKLAEENGVPAIGVSSSAYVEEPSRHPEGLHLHEVCRYWIDTGVPHGDTSYVLEGSTLSMGPLSSVAGIYILNCLLARAAEICIASGIEPAVYVSGNVTGGRERNEAVIARYRTRIRHL